MDAEYPTRDREADIETPPEVLEQRAICRRKSAHQKEDRGDRNERGSRQADAIAGGYQFATRLRNQ
jgi:hypothetical protein